jgi:D-proline reductase (dithiol) PrdB
VLRAALALLEAPAGPVLDAFPEDAPVPEDGLSGFACPVSFDTPPADLSAMDLLRAALQREIGQLRTWYDLGVARRGRTTVGLSGMTPEELGTFIGDFLDAGTPSNPRPELPLATLFRFAVEDLKSYYCEAVTAQPGQQAVDSTVLADWFWRETTAGRVLFAVHDACQHSDVPGIQVVANSFLIPRARMAESPYAKA